MLCPEQAIRIPGRLQVPERAPLQPLLLHGIPGSDLPNQEQLTEVGCCGGARSGECLSYSSDLMTEMDQCLRGLGQDIEALTNKQVRYNAYRLIAKFMGYRDVRIPLPICLEVWVKESFRTSVVDMVLLKMHCIVKVYMAHLLTGAQLLSNSAATSKEVGTRQTLLEELHESLMMWYAIIAVSQRILNE